MSYEFQNTLHRTAVEMQDAIAFEWLTAGGANGREECLEFMRVYDDEAIAEECIYGFGLHDEWMKDRETDIADLVAAFSRLLCTLDLSSISAHNYSVGLCVRQAQSEEHRCPMTNPWRRMPTLHSDRF